MAKSAQKTRNCPKMPIAPGIPKLPGFAKCLIKFYQEFLGYRFLARDGRADRSTSSTRFPRWSKSDAILPVNLPNGSLDSPRFRILPSTKISIKDEKSALSKIQSRGYIHQCEPKASSPALKLNFVELSIFKGVLLSLLSLFFRPFDSEGEILGQIFLSWVIPFPKTYLHAPKKRYLCKI